jgi:hypothetical protein
MTGVKVMKIVAVLLMLMLLGTAGVFAGTALAAEEEKNMQTVIYPAGSQGTFKGPEAWFTGNVKVDMLFPDNKVASYGGAVVTFSPGARTAWQRPPGGSATDYHRRSGLDPGMGRAYCRSQSG